MIDKQKEIIQKSEKYIRHYASMLGHTNADMLMQLVHLAKKQEIEISRLSSIENSTENSKENKNCNQLIFENIELRQFKNTTKEIVGDVILDLIEERMADK